MATTYEMHDLPTSDCRPSHELRQPYFERIAFPVQDAASFTVLDYGFAKDRLTGYYQQEPVPSSDGSTFAFVDNHYSKDAASVFYSWLEPGTNGSPPVRNTVRVTGAQPASFEVLDAAADSADAKDDGARYQHGRRVTR